MSERLSLAGRIAVTQRHHGPDDPRLPALRRDLRAAELEEHVRRIVEQAPPLTAAQRERIAGLLRTPAVAPSAARVA